jgi:Major Facilitator Superfamily
MGAVTEKRSVSLMSDATSNSDARDRRWLILGVIGLAQLMVVLDLTVMNIALPSAQRALNFTTVDRQWVVTAYTLAFGSLLLLGGRLADLFGRKVTFLAGLAGFAGVSAMVTLGALFALWQVRAANPLLPPRVVLDRSRGGAYLSMLIGTAGLFGTLLFLTYYLQQTLGYSPLITGFAFLPMSAGLIVMANLSTTVLMPRFGPKPLVAFGMLAAAGGTAWLAQLGPHTGYAVGVLDPLILTGVGLGMVIAPAINTGTFGVAPQDAGVASATVTVGQMLGGSIGTSLLNTIFTSAIASYIAAHLAAVRLIGRQALTGLAQAHGYHTAFWWTAGIFAGGAVIAGALLRRGPLVPTSIPSRAQAKVPAAEAKAGPALVIAPRAKPFGRLYGR